MAAAAAAGASPAEAGPVDLWAHLQEMVARVDRNEAKEDDIAARIEPARDREAFVLFAGGKGSGKSTLVQAFLNPTKMEATKPTVALEYTFGRRSAAAGTSKDVAHVWELGGGAALSELINVPLTPQRLPTAVAVVVVDLGQPATALPVATRLFAALRARATECLTKLRSKSPKTAQGLEGRAAGILAEGHPDRHSTTPLPIPAVLVGAKYDQFRELDSARRRTLIAALRYLAHVHGAGFVCTASNDRQTLAKFRAVLNTAVFQSEGRLPLHLDPLHPVCAPAGTDSIESIGAPAGVAPGQLTAGPVERRIEAWRPTVESAFPPDAAALVGALGEASDVGRATWAEEEPVVDEAVQQKEDERERYSREAERKLKLEARALAGGAGDGRRRRARGAAAAAAAGGGASAGGGSRRQRSKREGK